ncbi:MAG TPA: class I SAM-dependent methyltransferase, partial [Balneolaceae bacterium]|nr:class I SAM-dependent methyltransferase [Balneolaceae bacterium]
MDWFEEWFNSPLYEKLYANRDEEEAKRLIELIEKFLIKNNSRKILGIACGRGRHAITLAEKGFDVTAFDLSERAIEIAKENAKKREVKNVSYMVHDMRKPLHEKFDAIQNLFTSFGYFEEDEENSRVFDNVAAMLRPGGIFVIDYLNAEQVKTNLVPSENGMFNDIHYTIKRYIEEGIIHKDIVFKKGEKTKKYT